MGKRLTLVVLQKKDYMEIKIFMTIRKRSLCPVIPIKVCFTNRVITQRKKT